MRPGRKAFASRGRFAVSRRNRSLAHLCVCSRRISATLAASIPAVHSRRIGRAQHGGVCDPYKDVGFLAWAQSGDSLDGADDDVVLTAISDDEQIGSDDEQTNSRDELLSVQMAFETTPARLLSGRLAVELMVCKTVRSYP